MKWSPKPTSSLDLCTVSLKKSTVVDLLNTSTAEIVHCRLEINFGFYSESLCVLLLINSGRKIGISFVLPDRPYIFGLKSSDGPVSEIIIFACSIFTCFLSISLNFWCNLMNLRHSIFTLIYFSPQRSSSVLNRPHLYAGPVLSNLFSTTAHFLGTAHQTAHCIYDTYFIYPTYIWCIIYILIHTYLF